MAYTSSAPDEGMQDAKTESVGIHAFETNLELELEELLGKYKDGC